MNSVDRHLTAETKAATLLAMRSARKEVLLVVEGDTDVETFANGLGLPRSNILSCGGKEMLMIVYGMAPQKGVDAGTIFIRDRDNDDHSTGVKNSVLILVTQRYDVEMELLENRLFGRIITEFTKRALDDLQIASEFDKLCRTASYIGAMRVYSKENDINLDFDDLKYTKFINLADMSVDTVEAVRYIFAKSEKPILDKIKTEVEIGDVLEKYTAIEIVCSKEFIDILHLALTKHYRTCPSGECLPIILSRTIRISTVHDDLKVMPLYQSLKAHVLSCGFAWTGFQL